MPLWVELYLLCVLGVAVASIWNNIRLKRPRWYCLLDTVNEFLILMVGTAYWNPGLGQSIAPVAFAGFILGVAWLPIEFKVEIASGNLKNPELTPTGNMVAILCGVVLGSALFAPLYYWGFRFAVLKHSALLPT